jgi:outer membrane pore protein F
MLPEWGGDTGKSDNFFSSRNGGLATYRNSGFFGLVDGLNFGVQYQAKMTVMMQYVLTVTAGQPQLAMISKALALWVHTAQLTVPTTSKSWTGVKAIKEQWATGLKYDANNIYLAALRRNERRAFEQQRFR